MKLNKSILPYIAILLPYVLHGQDKTSIKVISEVKENRVTLRWAVDNAIGWEHTNKTGFIVERYTLVRDGKLLKQPEKTDLTEKPLMPKPLPEWESLAKLNKYGAIAAQALYGKTFQINENSDNVIQMINKSKETDSRFSFALFCADQSLKVAEWMGLVFKDSSVVKGEKYLYKVYTSIPSSKMIIDTGMAFVDTEKLSEYPKPVKLQAESGDRMVTLSWERIYHEAIYSSYTIERSADGGKTFTALSDEAYLTTSIEPTRKSNKEYFIDSLPTNYKKFYYRVKGKNYFGEYGEVSETIETMGITAPKALPIISAARVVNNKITLEWTYPSDINFTITGFKVYLSANANSGYKEVSKYKIRPSDRAFEINKPLSANYIKVAVLDVEGREYLSMPVLVQLEDKEPPMPPTGLTAIIDTTGILKVSWNKNTEQDLSGYRVYISNSLKDEFTQITKSAIMDTLYSDSVTLKTITKELYVKVVAEDFRFNHSKFSEIIKVERPDIVPPVVPVFIDYNVSDSSVYLSWSESPSKDVENFRLYRRQDNEENWQAVAVLKVNQKFFTDKTLKQKINYFYSISAVDESNNESEKSQPLTVRLVPVINKKAIEKISITADRTEKYIQLKWEYTNEGVERFEIYKAEGDKPLRLFKTVSSETFELKDTNLNINTKYRYSIRAKFNDGSSTSFSKEISINY